MNLGPTELIIILVIAIIIFGAGKVADVGGALGKSVREFRKAVDPDSAPPQAPAPPQPPAPAVQQLPPSAPATEIRPAEATEPAGSAPVRPPEFRS